MLTMKCDDRIISNLNLLVFLNYYSALLTFQMLEASLYISEHLPDGASGLWAVVHCATWVALGELEWIPFAVLRKSIDVNLLGKCFGNIGINKKKKKKGRETEKNEFFIHLILMLIDFN